ncbi:MAG TPA: hypothetical protein DDZ66_04720 [Firmicutes bacterium]|jgi:YbbR domain-containing protein|nr:hypothetical protein [Bacillota bacterium]
MSRISKLWSFLTKPEVYWRLFSLALAIIFWLLATGDGTLGETERTITLGVQVQNIPADLVLVDPPESVRVRIRGLSPLVNRGESSVSASIDLAGAVQGTETYSVEVDGPLGISVVSVTPQWVSVYTEDVAEAAFPVTLVFLGIDRNRMMMEIRPSPAVITVRGPRSILERVDHVVAYLGIDPELNLETSFPVLALDAQGRSLDGLDIDPPEIRVIEVVDNGEE